MRTAFISKLIAILSLFLMGCASALIPYQPQAMLEVKDASSTVEELTMMQPSDVRPDFVKVNESYILWNHGVSGSSRPSRSIFKHASTIEVHEASERVYFNSIENIEIYSKKGWYYVYIHCKNIDKYAFYTEDLNEAKRFADAVESLRAHKTASLKQ